MENASYTTLEHRVIYPVDRPLDQNRMTGLKLDVLLLISCNLRIGGSGLFSLRVACRPSEKIEPFAGSSLIRVPLRSVEDEDKGQLSKLSFALL